MTGSVPLVQIMLKYDNFEHETPQQEITKSNKIFQYPTLPSQNKTSVESGRASSSSSALSDSEQCDTVSRYLSHQLEEEKQFHDFSEKKSKILECLSECRVLVESFLAYDDGSWTVLYPGMSSEHLVDDSKFANSEYQFKVIAIDIRPNGKESAKEVIKCLDTRSVAHLLKSRLGDSVRHLIRITQRVSDTLSKVLITGDLNSGKSTFINSLLRRDILPYDQQPCTTMFCEVASAHLIDGQEEVHGIIDPSTYDCYRLDTYTRFNIPYIKHALTQEEVSQYKLWRVYCNEKRSKRKSLLHNGVLDMVIIDSPGLNRDFTQTMAVFAQHEEIDAVIFVVNCENHFTLSGVEFLTEARREKPYMFIVANRFDVIKDRKRCRMNIMKQIKELLPETEKHAEELVHFVSAREFMKVDLENESDNDSEYTASFANLEACLHTFLLEKRSRTKLAPAKIFVTNLLQDMLVLAEYNEFIADNVLNKARKELQILSPTYQSTVEYFPVYNEYVDRKIGENMHLIHINSQMLMDNIISYLSDQSEIRKEVRYGGIFKIWGYAENIVKSANQRLIQELYKFEKSAAEIVDDAVQNFYQTAQTNIECWASVAEPVDQFKPACKNSLDLDIRESSLITVNIDISDFLVVPKSVISTAVSIGALGFAGCAYVGFGQVSSKVITLGSMIGLDNSLKIASVTILLFGALSGTVIISNARQSIEERLQRKIRRQIKKSEKIQRKIHKIGYESRKNLEKAAFAMKRNLVRISEIQEEKCAGQRQIVSMSSNAKEYFSSLKQRSKGLLELLSEIRVDSLGEP